MCGLTKGIEDAVEDIGDFASDTWEGIEDIGQDVVDFGSDVFSGIDDKIHSSFKNIPDMMQSGVDLTKLAFTAPTEIATTALTNPFEPDKWYNKASDSLAEFDDIGTDLFGSGSWATGAANYYTGGSGGTTLARLVEGDDYTPGSTTPATDLYGMYNMANNMYNSVTTPSYTSGEGFTSNQGSLQGYDLQAPPNYTPNFSGADLATTGQNLSAGYSGGSDMSYVNGDGFSDNTGYLPGYNIGQGMDTSSPYVNQAPDFWDQFSSIYNDVSGYINSPGGKLATGVVARKNPDLANLTRLATAGGDGGGYGQAIDSLASLYKSKQTRKQLQQTQGVLDTQLNAGLQQYAPGSAYEQQLRKTLERQDAAAGRRSQYGTREVELQARLADKQNQLRSEYMKQAPTIAGSNAAIANARNAGVADLFSLYGKNYKQINKGVSDAASSLYDYFRG